MVAWTKDTVVHLKRIKSQLADAPIMMTQFQSMGYSKVDEAIATIAGNMKGVHAIDSTKARLGDANHWDYEGLEDCFGAPGGSHHKGVE